MRQAAFPGKNSQGQSLLELLIAIAIVSITLGSAIIVVFGNQSLFTDKRLAARASALAAEGLAAVKSVAERSWDELSLGQHGLTFGSSEWQFSGTQDVTEIFTRQISITSGETNVKDIVSKVSWQTDPQRPLKVELTLRLTNWQGLFGDWQNPQTLGTVDLGPGEEGTDLKVRNKIVYMTAEASAVAKPDFFIINATNGASPFIVSSLNTGPGLNAIAIGGDYAYVAQKSSTQQLQIINISNINNPSLVTSYALPGITGSGAEGQTVFYRDSKVYIGTKVATGPEFHIIDVANPASPISLGSYAINDNVNEIYIDDDRAYLATDLNMAGLMILDVSNPASITLLGQAYASDTKSVHMKVPSQTFIGPAQDLYIVNASNPGSIATIGSINAGDIVQDVFARDYLVFLATANSNKEFQVINIANPASPTLHAFFNFPQVATGIDYENNIVYVSVRSNDALRIITSM